MKRWSVLLMMFTMVACGKHEIQNSGFTKVNEAQQGDKPTTPAQFMKLAIEQGDRKSFEKILSQGYEVNTILANGRTALIHSIYNDNPLFVSLLIKAGADTSIMDGDGKTALVVAQELEHTRIALMLDPAQQVIQQAKLFAAISDPDNDNVDPDVKASLEAGTDPNFIDEATGETPLTMAIKNLSNGGVRLIKWDDPGFGVTMTNVNMPNAAGEMPLTLALALKKPAYKKKFVEALTNKNAVEVIEPPPAEETGGVPSTTEENP